MSGWIKLHRKLQDNPLWLSEPFTRAQAWVDLMMLANHKEGFVRVRGNRIAIPRGSLGRSKAQLGERWKWSRGKVLRFLKELESEQQIVQETVHGLVVINLCKYSEFNDKADSDGTPNDTQDGTPNSTTDGTTDGHETVHGTVQEQEGKNEKKGKKERSKGAKKFTPPPEINLVDWKNFEEHRTKIRKPMTSRAKTLICKAVIACAAHNGVTTSDVIDHAISKGWAGMGADWKVPNPSRGASSDQSSNNAKLAAEMFGGAPSDPKIIEGEVA